jgi:hypothetical protein
LGALATFGFAAGFLVAVFVVVVFFADMVHLPSFVARVVAALNVNALCGVATRHHEPCGSPRSKRGDRNIGRNSETFRPRKMNDLP